jgi:hypothetical protein
MTRSVPCRVARCSSPRFAVLQMSMEKGGKVVWAKNNEIVMANVKTADMKEVSDGDRIPVRLILSCQKIWMRAHSGLCALVAGFCEGARAFRAVPADDQAQSQRSSLGASAPRSLSLDLT